MTDRAAGTRKSLENPPVEELEKCEAESGSLSEETLRTKFKHLSAMDLFHDLTRDEIAEIDRATVMWECKAGRVFYRPGETGDVLFILKKGAVQLYRKSVRGRKLVIEELKPYALFGEMTCLGQGMHQRYASTTEDSLVCTMKQADVERLLLSKPQVARRLIQVIGQRAVQLEVRLEEFAFKEAKSRIAAFLLRAAVGNEVKGLRHQDIADTLGIFRETVTDALAELKSSEIIKVERRRITILNRTRLEDRAA